MRPFQGYKDEPGKPHCLTCGHRQGECDEHPAEESCEHPNKQYTGALYDGPAGCKTFLYYTCPDCGEKLKLEEQEAEACTCGPDEACGDCPEPPLTAEEEEEAPKDCVCGDPFGLGVKHRTDGPCHMKELPPPEGPEYTPCVCDHIEPEHYPDDGSCRVNGCECLVYRTKPDFELPPQPLRRPPYAVGYSVQGHLYEVALPGDATVRAVDGALVIQHHLGPVAGIVSVLPVINEEAPHGAEADQ